MKARKGWPLSPRGDRRMDKRVDGENKEQDGLSCFYDSYVAPPLFSLLLALSLPCYPFSSDRAGIDIDVGFFPTRRAGNGKIGTWFLNLRLRMIMRNSKALSVASLAPASVSHSPKPGNPANYHSSLPLPPAPITAASKNLAAPAVFSGASGPSGPCPRKPHELLLDARFRSVARGAAGRVSRHAGLQVVSRAPSSAGAGAGELRRCAPHPRDAAASAGRVDASVRRAWGRWWNCSGLRSAWAVLWWTWRVVPTRVRWA